MQVIGKTQVRIGKELGLGYIGAVYEAVDANGNHYAVKIQKVLKDDTEESFKNAIWREIEFAETMYKVAPEYFMKLHDHCIVDECKHVQRLPGVIAPVTAEFFAKRSASKYCSYMLFSPIVDMTFDDFNGSKAAKLSLVKQLAHAIYLIDKQGYRHDSITGRNIGLIKTDDKYMTIMGTRVPLYGYKLCMLDYGSAKHAKYGLVEKQMGAFASSEALVLLSFISGTYALIDHIRILNKKTLVVSPTTSETNTLIKYDPGFKKAHKKAAAMNPKTADKAALYLFHVMYPARYQQIVLQARFKANKVLKFNMLTPSKDYLRLINMGLSGDTEGILRALLAYQ